MTRLLPLNALSICLVNLTVLYDLMQLVQFVVDTFVLVRVVLR